MQRFRSTFPHLHCNLIGMIHVSALPGSPKNSTSISEIIDKACTEAEVYRKFTGIDSVMIENMHDVPYLRQGQLGPETVSGMTAVAREIRKIFPSSFPLGIQILAGANKEALAVAKSTDFNFIRAEGFVFGHLGDEGWFESCAGSLLRYRQYLKAQNIQIFTDIKKKHSAHSVTQDVDLEETAKASNFFCSDGIILTGSCTGEETNPDHVSRLARKEMDLPPILVGSGITAQNVEKFGMAHGLIVGSYFKKEGKWENNLDPKRVEELCNKISKLNLKK